MTSGVTLLFSDVHGRADRLQRLFRLYPDTRAVCLGDTVGGGDNDLTLRLIKERAVPVVLGNHEADLIHLYKVDERYRAWIRTWPRSLAEADVLFIHTWLRGAVFERIDSISSASLCFESYSARVIFVGHSHSPGWWELRPDDRPRWTHASRQREFLFSEGARYIVDVGSLGEPERAEDPHYVLWDEVGIRWYWLPDK